MDVQQKPRFKNCCESCVWLGQFNEFDLYFCSQRPATLPTVIARFGNHGADYASGLLSAGVVPELGEARRRAIDAGLLTTSNKIGLTVVDLNEYLNELKATLGPDAPCKEPLDYLKRKIPSSPMMMLWNECRRADWMAWLAGMLLPNPVMVSVLDTTLKLAGAPPITENHRAWFLSGRGYRAFGIIVMAMPTSATQAHFDEKQRRFTAALRQALPWEALEPAARKALLLKSPPTVTTSTLHSKAA